MAFEVAGGKAAAFRVANAFSIIGISNDLGDAQEPRHPSGDDDPSAAQARTAARRSAGAPGLLRLSVGLEDVDDLIEDLAQALDKAALPRQQAAE